MARTRTASTGPREIDVKTANRLCSNGALLVDIREPYEFNAEHIPGSLSRPMSATTGPIETDAMAVIYYCQTGDRTMRAAGELSRLTSRKAFSLTGGLLAWKAEGLPTEGGETSALVGADLLRRLLGSLKRMS